MLLLERAVVWHPSCHPYDFLTAPEGNVLSNFARQLVSDYEIENDIVGVPEQSIMRIIYHCGTIIIVCLDRNIMSILMRINDLPAKQRLFRGSDV